MSSTVEAVDVAVGCSWLVDGAVVEVESSDGSVGLALMSFEVVAVGVVASVDVSAVFVAVIVAVTGVSTTVIIADGCIAASLPVVQLGSTFRVVMLVSMM